MDDQEELKVAREALEHLLEGYEGAMVTSDPTGLSATLRVYYVNPGCAENALGAIATLTLINTWGAQQHAVQREWVSVSDRLPQNDSQVWASWTGAGNFKHDPKQGLARYVKNLGWQLYSSTGWDWNVTHWMPLPQLPAT